MPRVMIIRHGESQDNIVSQRLSLQLRKGRITEAEFQRQMQAGLSPDGDAPLSERGFEQARLLAEYYAPILSDVSRRGLLHFYCSPFLRNLQTADPLLRALRARAEVRVDLGEVPGLLHYDDMRRVNEVAQRGDVAAARRVLRATEWRPAGMTAAQIEARFPWARAQGGGAFPADAGPWWRGGWETPEQSRARVKRIHAWIGEAAASVGPEDIVAFVCHGQTMAMLLQEILALGSPDVYFENIDNTSVTMLLVGEVAHGPGPRRAHNLYPQPVEAAKVQLEFFSRCDHLGERMHGYFQYVNIMPRQKYKEWAAAKGGAGGAAAASPRL